MRSAGRAAASRRRRAGRRSEPSSVGGSAGSEARRRRTGPRWRRSKRVTNLRSTAWARTRTPPPPAAVQPPDAAAAQLPAGVLGSLGPLLARIRAKAVLATARRETAALQGDDERREGVDEQVALHDDFAAAPSACTAPPEPGDVTAAAQAPLPNAAGPEADPVPALLPPRTVTATPCEPRWLAPWRAKRAVQALVRRERAEEDAAWQQTQLALGGLAWGRPSWSWEWS